MKHGLRKKILVVLGLLVFLFMLVFACLVITMNKPPLPEIKSCLEALAKADRVNADVYAPEYYKAAENKYKAAMKEYKLQNADWFFLRNYDKVKELVVDATLKAQEANYSSGSKKDDLKMNYLKETELLKKKLDNYHAVFIKLPLKAYVRKNYEFGKFALEEGLSAFGKGDFMLANKKLNEGKIKISLADNDVNALLKDYFSNYSKWQNWVSRTIKLTAQNSSNAFIVDKIQHKGYLYYNGKLREEFDVEFGKNWIGDKQYAGDRATPEGMYLVTKKKSSRDTKYYKALMINYPNDEDRAQFAERKRKGMLSRNSRLGGLIEIHGEGGKGSDWTIGCVALPNDRMDELYSRLSTGSPITIVGSMVSLSELLN
jgi:L,D-peptidoglycan transpeptidase YkuD (ErfK/YbiS/YcfS/YnhG family)